MVEPTFAEKTLIRHTDYLTNAQVITSRATNINETEVLTENGTILPYDYLVIATGHDYAFPRSPEQRLDQFQEGEFHLSFFQFNSL